ncbi:MAG TPA: flagellar motor switch protein FliN [Pirellulales bacterium]|nr:flagellar motor switch protein FliN [Pirellulales bacterium]
MADELRQVDQDEIERLLARAERTIASTGESSRGAFHEVRPFELVEFATDASNNDAPNTGNAQTGSYRDVEMDLALEFGRARIDLQDVLNLRKGSVVPLDKLATDPVDIVVNGRLIAKGELLVLNDNFCVRVAELVAGESGL